ncbi:thioredoxin-like protein, partial [Ilyonectria destructans]
MTNFKITVTSDTLCPWCYIGRKQLHLAEQLWKQAHPASHDTFTVTHQAIQLQPIGPTGPASSISKEQFFAEKFGKQRSEKIHEHIKDVGKTVGISFKFGGQTGNSRDANRLIQMAKGYGAKAESKTIDGLFAAYFEQQQDITQYDTLKSIANEAGILTEDFQQAIIDSDEGGQDVDQATMRSRLRGVTSVPHFTIQDRYEVRGSRSPEEFLRIFKEIQAEEV